jgi:GNAT superfamily N-acetyltransferase
MFVPDLLHPDRLPVLVCRPALPMDTPQVLELARHIWDGHDYIPFVWEEWLADPAGLLVVAELGRQIVGLGKLTFLSPGQWWLEGLRVHPEFEGRGFASHINDYLLECWMRHGGGHIRLITSSKRVKVHSMCAHRGFAKIGEYSVYGAPAIAETVDSFTPISLDEAPQALEFIRRSPALPLLNGLMDRGWRWEQPSLIGLQSSVRRGQAWWWQGKRGLLTFWEDEDNGKKYPALQLVACPVEAMAECLLDYRRLAASQGYADARWTVPYHLELLPILEEAGFKLVWDERVYMFEKKSPNSE